jgi:dCMP deaminase
MGLIWDQRFLALAAHVAGWSKDPSTKVGAVVVDDKRRVAGLGYNGLPRGVRDTAERLHDREVKYRMVVHAEANAILNAPLGVEGCTMYLTHPPCCGCAKLMIQAGVVRVVFRRASPDLLARWGDDLASATALLEEADVDWESYP